MDKSVDKTGIIRTISSDQASSVWSRRLNKQTLKIVIHSGHKTEKTVISSSKAAGKQQPDLHEIVLSSLDDDKAVDIVSIDLTGKTSLADFMVIASGTSQRHISAMADHISKRTKQAGYKRPSIEGQALADWVLIDTGDIIVHLFRPEVRDFYALEKMWSAALTDEVRESAETATG